MTNYTILFKAPVAVNATGGQPGWELLATTYDAASNTAAIRAAAAATEKPGTYVAIPTRSFEQVSIEIDLNPRVKVVKP